MMGKVGDEVVEVGTVRGGPLPRRRVAFRRADGTVVMAKSRGEGWQITTSPQVIRSFRAEVTV